MQTASGQKLTYYGHKTVHFALDSGAILQITFKVVDVVKPILSIGSYYKHHKARYHECDREGGMLYHESAGRVPLIRALNHYALEVWTQKPMTPGTELGGFSVQTCKA